MRYFVTIADRTLEVDITGPTPLIDGKPVEAKLSTVPGTDVRHLLVGSESHTLIAKSGRSRGLWSVSLNGRALHVEVLDERTRAIRAMSGGAETEVDKVVVAPMPGLVVRVNVEPGQSVVAGQGVIVVEAMKMENELKAPADGIVARIEVEPGATVEKGTVLIVLS